MKELLRLLGRMGLVLLVGTVPLASRMFLPLRHHDGTWRMTRSSLEWIAAPPEVTQCLPGPALQASR